MAAHALPRGLAAVVTGAGGGLGRELALELARRGARVVVSDIDGDAAAETASMLQRTGAEAHSFQCDVSDHVAVQQLREQAETVVGPVDLVCNNAGVAVGGKFEEIGIDDWRWCVDVNLWGVVHGCHVFAPGMKARGRGYILNVASAAGLLSAPLMSPYNVTKAGVVALSETLHAEMAKSGVRVTALCPTFFKTNILESGHGLSAKTRAVLTKRMQSSALQAPDVARVALDGLAAGELYVVPMRDGRAMWRLKRLAPGFYGSRFADVMELVGKRLGFGK